MRRHVILIFSFLAFGWVTGVCQAQDTISIPDTLSGNAPIDTNYLDEVINYGKNYSFVDYSVNFIEWYHPSAIAHFFNKLGETDNKKVRVLHMGDSHIQADYYPGFVRTKLQDIFGAGGRGFIFPYKSANTHATYDYYTLSSGKWEFSRNVLQNATLDIGITGATIRTSDTVAGFAIIFRPSYNSIQEDFKKIRLLFKKDTASFDLTFSPGRMKNPINLSTHGAGDRSYIEFLVPEATDSMFFFIRRSDTTQKFFECYGILIESTSECGVLYSSVGINGAGYRALLRENKLEEQLIEYQPDLVILDLGENDYYRNQFDDVMMETNLSQILKIIRTAAPECNIMLTNSQDNYYRKQNIRENEDFADFTRRMAMKYQCILYDFYHVCGGRYSMLDWYRSGLAQKDKIHLSGPGYALKGELFVNGLLNSYREYLTNQGIDSLVVGRFIARETELPTDFEDILSEKQANDTLTSKPLAALCPAPPKKSFHLVRRGENLSVIAEMYRLTVADLMKWNDLSSSKLYAGQKLHLENPLALQKEREAITARKSPMAEAGKTNITYQIKSGDNLGSIAEKFDVRVSDLKRWNNLKNTKIQANKTLILYVKSTAEKTGASGKKSGTSKHTGSTLSHQVKEGESLWRIAKKYQVTVDEIKADNQLTLEVIKPGMILKIRK